MQRDAKRCKGYTSSCVPCVMPWDSLRRSRQTNQHSAYADIHRRAAIKKRLCVLCALCARKIMIHVRCALCARKKVGSMKSEVGSEVGSMTERHFIQRRSIFPMRDNELKTPLRPLRPLREKNNDPCPLRPLREKKSRKHEV